MKKFLGLLVVFCWMGSFGLAHAGADLSDAIAHRAEAEKALNVMKAVSDSCPSLSSPEDIVKIAIEGFGDPNLDVVIPSFPAVQEACSLGLISFWTEDLQKALGLSTKEFTLDEITNGINNYIMLLRKYPEISLSPNAEINRLLLVLNYYRQSESISPQSAPAPTTRHFVKPPDKYGTGWAVNYAGGYGGPFAPGCNDVHRVKCERRCPFNALQEQKQRLYYKSLYGILETWSGGVPVEYDPSNRECCFKEDYPEGSLRYSTTRARPQTTQTSSNP